MVAGRLPDEGPVRLGPVDLPPGRLIMGCVGMDHVAWVTKDPVPGAGRVWAALSGLHPRTGLVPIQVDGRPGKVRDPLNLSSPRTRATRTGWTSAPCSRSGGRTGGRTSLTSDGPRCGRRSPGTSRAWPRRSTRP